MSKNFHNLDTLCDPAEDPETITFSAEGKTKASKQTARNNTYIKI